MANIKSKEKNIRRIEKKTIRNKAVKSQVKTSIRAAREAAESKSEDLKTKTSQAHKQIDKAVSKGVLHSKTGARKKSRLDAYVAKQTLA